MTQGRLFLVAILVMLGGVAGWLLFSEGRGGERGGFAARTVTVKATALERQTFRDIVEAIGTAQARESVTLTARVSDTVEAVHFDDGQVVSRNDLLVSITDDEEQALMREAEATLLEATQQLKRTEDLVTRGNASVSTLDTQRRVVTEAQSRLTAARARLNDRKIRAPFDGVLGLRQVSEGALLSQSAPITTIDAIDIINLDFSVPERFIATLTPGQSVQARVDAYPDRLFEGKVKTIDSRVDPATRSVIVRAEIPNPSLLLRPGMLMTVEVISRVWEALAVPEEAVVPTGGANYVFIVSGDRAERRRVELGLRRPGYVEVLSGLSGDDRVVTEGTLRLGRQGIQVRVLDDTPEREGAPEARRRYAGEESPA